MTSGQTTSCHHLIPHRTMPISCRHSVSHIMITGQLVSSCLSYNDNRAASIMSSLSLKQQVSHNHIIILSLIHNNENRKMMIMSSLSFLQWQDSQHHVISHIMTAEQLVSTHLKRTKLAYTKLCAPKAQLFNLVIFTMHLICTKWTWNFAKSQVTFDFPITNTFWDVNQSKFKLWLIHIEKGISDRKIKSNLTFLFKILFITSV